MTNLRTFARNQECQIRLPGCDGGGATTVLAHYRLAGYSGMGLKPDDFAFGAWSCAVCHDLVDGRTKTDMSRDIVRLAHAEGVMRSMAEIMKLKKEGKL